MVSHAAAVSGAPSVFGDRRSFSSLRCESLPGSRRCRGPLRSRDSLSANFTQILCEFWAPMLICRAAAKVKIPRR